MSTNQKTARMLAAEVGRGPMETWLPKLIEEKGQSAAADVLGVNRRTLRDWMLILGLRRTRTVRGGGRP